MARLLFETDHNLEIEKVERRSPGLDFVMKTFMPLADILPPSPNTRDP
jgi:hypothetical protein